MRKKLAVQPRNIRDLRLNAAAPGSNTGAEPWKLGVRQSEDLNHPPILLLSNTPQSEKKESSVSQQRVSDKKTVRVKEQDKAGG